MPTPPLGSSENPKLFRTQKAFLTWFEKNHEKRDEIWVLFFKKGFDQGTLAAQDASDIALCYGWINIMVRRVDQGSYKTRFKKRRVKSIWSPKKIKEFQKLKKQGLVQPSGEKAFRNRDKEKSEGRPTSWPPALEKKFKKNKKAWAFYSQAAPSYRKYTLEWVLSSKVEKTRLLRLNELIQDSSEGTKLRRVLKAQERVRPTYPKGETPIEAGLNIGPVTGGELRSIGITTTEKLEAMGWEEAFGKLIEMHPHRLNLNMLKALAGCWAQQKSSKLDEELKSQVRRLFRRLQQEPWSF